MDQCNVCGGTDAKLVDGFYYCVECGTQDVNVRETVVEQTMMGEGTFAHTTSRKITKVVKEGIEMSSEWYKWHIFNFILAGLTDELIALGAKPTVKMKVLWIWSRYIKKFQEKDDLQSSKSKLDIEDENDSLKGGVNNENDTEDHFNDDSDDESQNIKSTKTKTDKIIRDMKTVTKGTILTILYVALNLDKSDIQLSHLFRFIREGRLSLYGCMKFVPKELKLNAVKNWKSFTCSLIEYNPVSIREMSLTCFKILKLGVPLVPDLRKLVKNFVHELCLPSDLKDLVFALMHFMPIEFLHIDAMTQKSLVRIPDYEGVCMAYILVALKICFGLDDDYEIRISNEVDKINDEENYLKSYKLGMFSEPSDRLFSFKEWCQYLQLRKYILCKNYLPMSRQFNYETDDNVFMEHLEKRRKREVRLSDDVTMDILNKIKSDNDAHIIPKADFPVTLTPMSTYIDVIAQRVQDPELRLWLCEDFSKYSLRYATQDLTLPGYIHDSDNPVVGVCESGKIFNKYVIGSLTVQEGDMTMVYVRNCQNKNWLITEPPKMHHVTKIEQNENSSDKESDLGYDSNIENPSPESDATSVIIDDVYKGDRELEIIDDLDDNKCIFDDNFIHINAMPSNTTHITIKEEQLMDNFFEIDTQSNTSIQNKGNSFENIENVQEAPEQFDPSHFDRDKIIKELIELACNKYKITMPKETAVRKQNKRKVDLTDDKTSSSEPKKQRTTNRSKPGEAKRVVNNFISAYYNTIHNDMLTEVSQQVKSIIEKVHIDDTYNSGANDLNRESILDEFGIMNDQHDTNNAGVSFLTEGEEIKSTEDDINDSEIQNNPTEVNSEDHKQQSLTEENDEDEVLQELFPKSDPKFDENEHDVRQLYVKLKNDLDTNIESILDITNDPEIDKIIQKQIERYSSVNRNSDENEINLKTERIDNSSDSDDDVPLTVLKDINCFEQERYERKREKLEPLLKEPSSLKLFKYWVRHYKSVYVVKSRDIGKKFDLELNDNLSISFGFVIRECAAILGYSTFSLYKNMQNIEEILIANAY